MKIITGIIFVMLLNGCAQSTSLLGPIFTGVSTGSVTQAGLSYGSNSLIKDITGKTSAENIQELLNGIKDFITDKIEQGEDASLTSFLEDVALATDLI